MQTLIQYLEQNKIQYKEIDENFISIDDKKFYLVKPDEEGKLFDDDFHLLTEFVETDYYCFQFGINWFYISDPKKVKLLHLKYLGQIKKEIELDYTFLGVHGVYELLNGSRNYKDWCKKAKFLGVKNLGICEKNTMAGILPFQFECVKNGIKPILGVTFTVKIDSDKIYDIKLFVKNEIGWNNLLSIYKELNIENNGYIYEKSLLNYLSGIVVVLDPKTFEFSSLSIKKIKDKTEDIFYSIDTLEYDNEDRDKWYLENLQRFLKSNLQPFFLCDAYYLDKEENHIKDTLNSISSKKEYSSNNQYFKSLDDIFFEFEELFKDDEYLFNIFQIAVENTNKIAELCNFSVPTKEKHLPKYIMNEDERKKFKNNNELFWNLIEQGLNKCPEDKIDEYIKRIEYEYEVISSGDLIDYFLILADICNWCRKEGILLGYARGSAAGSLVSFMLNITQVDPLKYDLLFERFLNPARVKKGLPDIDVDIQPLRKDDVKNYIKNKYGADQFAYIGTYSSLQLKGVLKELARLENIDFGTINYLCAILDSENINGEFEDIFINACQKKQWKEFVQENSNLINDIPLLLGSLKATSIHACAVLVLPTEKDIYHWMPCRWAEKDDQKILVTEWEGEELNDSNFLKEDILVIEQLDKYRYCLDLIKETTGKEIDIYNIPLDEEGVYELFRKGFCSDIFQFGSKGLTSYLKQLQPYSFKELYDATALYRPGAMDVNSHQEYILRKFGDREITYKFGCEDITKETNGLLVYQEQIIKICSSLGGFSLAEADDIRKAVGKKKKDLIDSYKIKFIEGAVKNGCPQDEAEDIWHNIEVHGRYSFNLSHAVSYTLNSYVGQWLKYHYPIQFWTTALQFANEELIPQFISEIHKLENIKVIPPHINNSVREFTTDYNKAEIYWSLTKIKFCGDKAVEAIITEREKNGNFYSLDEFLRRVEKRVVNKRIVINLIISGAFDEIEDIENKKERGKLIDKYYKLTKSKRDEEDQFLTAENSKYEWRWILKQREITGFGVINYKAIIKISDLSHYIDKYIDSSDFYNEENENKDILMVGIVSRFVERNGKKGEYAHIEIDSNNEIINVTIWSDTYKNYKESLKECEGKILIIKGVCKFDSYKKTQVVQSVENSELQVI